MVNLVSFTSLFRILYLSSLAIVIGVGGYYADYLRKNDINRNNEIATISLIIFALIFFVISLRNISKYTLGSNANMLLNVLFFIGLAGSFGFTVYYYYQDKDEISEEYTTYFYTILVFSAIAILLLISLILFDDQSFKSVDKTYIDMNSKKIALRQAKERMEYIINKSNVKKDKDIIESYQGLIKDIDNGINDSNKLNNLVLRASYLYGKDQFVMNVLLSDSVKTGSQKEKFNYKEAFDKMNELKESTKTIKLKNVRKNDEQDYNYIGIYTEYISQFGNQNNMLNPLHIFGAKYCNDLLGHLPVVHDPKQDIIKDVEC